MGKVLTFADKLTGQNYTISTVSRSKKVIIDKKSFHTICETAFFEGKPLRLKKRKPICIFELLDMPKIGLSLEEFHEKISELVQNNSVNDLLSPYSSNLYLGYGFLSKISESWQLFLGSKVKFVYLVPKSSVVSIPFMEVSPNKSLHAWEIYLDDMLKPYLEEEMRKLKQMTSANKKDVVKASKLLSLQLMADAANFTQEFSEIIVANKTQVKEESREIRLDKNLTFFKTVLVLYLLLAYGYSESRLGKDTKEAETFDLAMNDTIMKSLEHIDRKMNATEAVVTEDIDSFFALQNTLSEEFIEYRWVEPDENQGKGDWGYEAGKKLNWAMYGNDAFSKSNEAEYLQTFVGLGSHLIIRFRDVTGQ